MDSGEAQSEYLVGLLCFTLSRLSLIDLCRIGEDRHVMTYTIAAGKSFNMVLSHVDHTDSSTWGQLSQDKILSDMRAEFEGWDPQ